MFMLTVGTGSSSVMLIVSLAALLSTAYPETVEDRSILNCSGVLTPSIPLISLPSLSASSTAVAVKVASVAPASTVTVNSLEVTSAPATVTE